MASIYLSKVLILYFTEEDFEYPCDDDDDLESCVRDYFAASDNCKPVSHQDGDPIFRKQKEVYFPKINLTVVTTDSNITYHNSQIRAFYLNKESGNLVFAIDFEYIKLYSNYSYFYFYQVAKEPIVTGDFVTGSYPCTLTAVIPASNGITKDSIKKARITAYLPTGYPPFIIGPRVLESLNPVIVKTVAALLADVPTAVLEIFLTGAPHFFLVYLQKYICDFGLPLSTDNWGNTIYT
ncbi:hypothetical protein ABMA27_003288 [Loxostege sticticalis]|uniref:Uncharacterized protein n=1 Tax=Loxostege sticticalis TaxID=481309 RepID=A0ABR3HSK9_LOXSC